MNKIKDQNPLLKKLMSLVRQICPQEISSNKNSIDQKLKNLNQLTRCYLQLTIVTKQRKNIKDKDRLREDPKKRSHKMISMQLMSVLKTLLMKAKCYKRRKTNSWVVMMMILVSLDSLKMTKKLISQISKLVNQNKKKKTLKVKLKPSLVDSLLLSKT